MKIPFSFTERFAVRTVLPVRPKNSLNFSGRPRKLFVFAGRQLGGGF